jgi:transposase
VFPLCRDPGRDGTGLVLDKVHRRFPWLGLFWADGDYDAWQVKAAVAKTPRLRMEIVKRSDNMRGFVVLPRRWVVERTFSWFGRNRRLAKDFENLGETLATFVTLASIELALRRLAKAQVVNSANHGLHRTVAKVCKSDGEETLAGSCATARLRRKRTPSEFPAQDFPASMLPYPIQLRV